MTDRHLNRQELFRAAKEGMAPFQDHLSGCEQCQAELSLLRRFRVAGKLELPEPPQGWVAKAIELASAKPSLAQATKRLIGALTFDSWSLPAPAGVRGLAPLTQRRIRLEADGVALEIRAEKKAQQWNFVAQTICSDTKNCSLLASSTHLQADEDGFFQWSSKTPPRSLILTVGEMVIEIPELSWKMPKP